ncbi:50S ribosomal protein L16 [Candidatus Woesearchaeota archaeon]|nr:50S ribosomal protein L16 [Candidatus Woesearchaeota archaeon]
MVGLRKFSCYRRLEVPYTRKSKYKKKGYVKAIPPHKIARFEMGEKRLFSHIVKLVSQDSIQIRHNAIESARLVVNKRLEENLSNNYFMKLNLYPHHAIRENKMLGGAHADRLQTGMAHSFGKVIGSAAQLKEGKTIFTVFVDKAGVESAKTSLMYASPRLPGHVTVAVEENKRGLIPS